MIKLTLRCRYCLGEGIPIPIPIREAYGLHRHFVEEQRAIPSLIAYLLNKHILELLQARPDLVKLSKRIVNESQG